MGIHTMKAAILVSHGMDFRVTDVLRRQPGWDELFVRIAASGVNPLDTKTFDGAAAHARYASPTIPVRHEWSAGHRRRCQVTAKDMMGADR
jgi:NADPH:quinone reductase-like Zn-dependent oxidoreductase